MASSKKNSSSHTTQSHVSPSGRSELKGFTAPLNALPLIKEKERERKEKEKEKERKARRLQKQPHDLIYIGRKATINYTEPAVTKRDLSPKRNKTKHENIPIKVLHNIAEPVKILNPKSPGVKMVDKSTYKAMNDEAKPVSQREKRKKGSGTKRTSSNLRCKTIQENTNGSDQSKKKTPKQTEEYCKKPQINTNTITPVSSPIKDHSDRNGAKNNESTEENELQTKINKEKEEPKARKLSAEIQSKLTVLISKTIQQRKIFAMGCSNFSTIKNALIKRGWIQKYSCEEPSLKTGIPPSDPESLFAHRMLRMVPINFIWVYTVSDWNDIKPHTIVNRFPRASAMHSFTTKIGLNYNLQQSHWFYESGVVGVKFPRTYSIISQEDLYDFVDDYIMTASTSLLKLVVRSVIRVENDLLQDGDVPQKTIEFAISRCNDYIAFREHRDIDSQGTVTPCEQTAKEFLKNFYKIVHEGSTFETAPQKEGTYLAAKAALHGIQRFRPQTNLDGYKNIWLLKQSNLNCGKGVQIMNTLEQIIDAVGEVKNPRYVIQKYIERPLLIYDTKFDIRQWFLLASINPLQIWMYNECYLRFSSQVFSLCDTSECVHLCNNVVQRRYKNGKRHPNLPSENMWDNTTFQKYLVDIGESDKWEKVIYPGMKECIIATVMAAQEDMVERVNSFELYGVDFMLTEDFRPWLIEVNASPAMGPTTSVTSRLCGQCLNDVVKVVIDRRINPRAETGQFTLIYKQETPTITKSMPADFCVIGKKIPLITKSNKYMTAERLPVLDLPKSNTAKDYCIKDSPSTCVMSVLMQKKSWVSDSRLNDKKKHNDDGNLTATVSATITSKCTKESKNIKSEDKQTPVISQASTEFIKSTIMSDLIKKTCLLTVYNEIKNGVKERDAEIIKKDSNDIDKNKIDNRKIDNNKEKSVTEIKTSAVKNNTKPKKRKNSTVKGNNAMKHVNGENNTKNELTINNADVIHSAKLDDDENNSKNEVLSNSIFLVENNEVKIISELNDKDSMKDIFVMKNSDDVKNISKLNQSTSFQIRNNEVLFADGRNNILKSCKEGKTDKINDLKRDVKNDKVNKCIEIIHVADDVDVKYVKDEKNRDLTIERTNREQSLAVNPSSCLEKNFYTGMPDPLAGIRNVLNITKTETNQKGMLKQSQLLHNYNKTCKVEEDKENAIQYTIYYNKDRTHFIVDVVENNMKKK